MKSQGFSFAKFIIPELLSRKSRLHSCSRFVLFSNNYFFLWDCYALVCYSCAKVEICIWKVSRYTKFQVPTRSFKLHFGTPISHSMIFFSFNRGMLHGLHSTELANPCKYNLLCYLFYHFKASKEAILVSHVAGIRRGYYTFQHLLFGVNGIY